MRGIDAKILFFTKNKWDLVIYLDGIQRLRESENALFGSKIDFYAQLQMVIGNE